MGAITRILLFTGDTPGGELPSGNTYRNDGLNEMMVRIGLFMLLLLVFMLVAGYAWRVVPGLRKVLPPYQPPAEEEKPEPRIISFNKTIPLTPVTPVETDPLADALADGRPGSVIKAAHGEAEQPRIIKFVREDE